MLAVVKGLKETEWLISGSQDPIKVCIDHKGIVDSTTNTGQRHGKVSRWITTLEEFDVKYIHRPRTDEVMKIADGMTRLPNSLRDNPMLVEHRLSFEMPGNTVSLPGGPPIKTTRSAEVLKLMEDWVASDWYWEIVIYLIQGRYAIDPPRRKLIARRALRYRIVGHRLYYRENTGTLSACITLGNVPLTLQSVHDTCGHFAAVITMRNLRGQSCWPTPTASYPLCLWAEHHKVMDTVNELNGACLPKQTVRSSTTIRVPQDGRG
ncbi:retrotransposable element [Fusarium albosuccineum]|uniref:Retrotransposable element n=1 Tax=Fusarium albosuccineum TaxID=1237068 RepID=A0A8H4KZ42_9HYPO|nr:retrotransposable element [Fusarium albosuccineum]